MGYTKVRLEHAYTLFRTKRATSKRFDSYADKSRQYIRGKFRGGHGIPIKQIATSWHDDDQEVSDGEWSPSERKRNKRPRRQSKAQYIEARNSSRIITLRLRSVKARNRLAVFEYLDGANSTFPSGSEDVGQPRCMFEVLGGSFERKEPTFNVFLSDPLIGSHEERTLRSGRVSRRLLSSNEELVDEHTENAPGDNYKLESVDSRLRIESQLEFVSSTKHNNGLGFTAPRVESSTRDLVTGEASGVPTSIRSSCLPVISEFRQDLSPPNTPARNIASPKWVPGGPQITTITTHYAHPINFQHVPTSADPCDFCSDYRTGILGLGRRTISVFVDNTHPALYQETGDGYRADGWDRTKMCVTCARKRLGIMTCHSADGQQIRTSGGEEGELVAQFLKIPGVSYSQQELQCYMNDLFQHAEQDKHMNGKRPERGPPPACSLCPAPGWWQCCRRLSVEAYRCVEASPRPASSASTPCIQCLSPSDPSSPTERNENGSDFGSLENCERTTLKVVAASGHELLELTNSVIPSSFDFHLQPNMEDVDQVMDDDSDEEPIEISAETFYSNRPPQSAPTPILERCKSIARGSSIHTPTPPSLIFPFNVASRTAPQEFTVGCGLTLCNQCKVFLERECGGILRRRKIMRMLTQENKFGPRADTEFLFEGGLLAAAYMR